MSSVLWLLPGKYGVPRRIRNLTVLVLLVFCVAIPGPGRALTITALGDSLTEGYGLADGDGLVPQLKAWLKARGEEVEIVNAGVSGDTTSGGLARIGWTLGRATDALIVELGGNDTLRGLDPGLTRANIDGILKEAAARDLPVLLVGLVAPTNYGPDYKAEFDAIWPELAATYKTLLYPDYFAALTLDADRSAALARWFQADGIHPNRDGVALIVEDFGPHVLDLIERARAK